MRQVSFNSDMGVIVSFEFNDIEFSDSQALHRLLTQFMPESDNYTVEFKEFTPNCEHVNMREIGMVGYFGKTEDCGFGCKVYHCERCDYKTAIHYSTYGCKKTN